MMATVRLSMMRLIRMRTATMPELVEWLAARTPEATSALSDVSKTDPLAVSASMAGFQSSNLLASFRDYEVPSLFVYGPNDPAVTPPSQERTDSLPTHMHQVNLEGTGHFPMIDNPTQFNRLMTDFLALDSGASPRELQMKEEWKRRVR
ncbi:MAG: alpha/beta hydrolase [Anaerolineales bacterium]|uniref:alpha/beta fold hydrolase n=1 Tax=Candidatus Villigracilis proximus TaxID=3140683 RepID=UPI0031375C49|nr:alpha/beta hydrolase [Anaerolineales bacterium]